MRFLRLISPHGFGCLKGPVDLSFAPDRLNLVLGENEAGKSTLMHALFYGLYGFSRSWLLGATRFRNKDEMISRYKPWNSTAPLSLTLEVAAGGDIYRIERDFENGRVRIWNLVRGTDETERFQVGKGKDNVGAQLLGLEEPVFLNTVCVNQNRLQAFEEAGDAAAVISEIQRAVEAGPGGMTVKEAVARIGEAQQKYGVTGNTRAKNKIQLLENQRSELTAKLQALADLHQKAMADLSENERLARRIQALEAERQAVSWQQRGAEHRELEIRLKSAREKLEKLARLQEEADTLAHRTGFFAHLKDPVRDLSRAAQEAGEQIARHTARLEVLREEFQGDSDTRTILLSQPPASLPEIREHLTRCRDKVREILRLETDLQGLLRELSAGGLEVARFQKFSEALEALSSEDQAFLMGYPQARAEADQASREALQQLSRLEATRIEQETALRQKRRYGILGMAAGALFLLGALWVGTPMAQVGLILLGVLLLGVSAFKLTRRRDHAETDALIADRARAQSAMDALEKRQAEARGRFVLLRRYFLDPAEVTAGEAQAETEFLQALARFQKENTGEATRWQRLKGMREQQVSEAVALISECAWLPLPSAWSGEALPPWISALEVKLSMVATVMAVRSEEAALEAVMQKAQDSQKQLEALLLQAGIPEVSEENGSRHPLDIRLAMFQKACQEFERLNSLQDQLKGLREGAESLESLRSAEDRLNQLEAELKERPEGIPDSSAELSENACRERLAALQRELEMSREQYGKSEMSVVEAKEQVYTQRPRLEAELEEVSESIHRLEDFRDALSLAREVLTEIGSENHREWAPVLNRRTGEYLEALSGRYGQLRFGENLSFSLEDLRTGQWLDASQVLQQLSVGARDQIYLSVRLAVARYLGEKRPDHDSLPLLLDDPFVHWDDVRFREAMGFLLSPWGAQGETAVPPQMLLFSCHRQRHQQWIETLTEGQASRIHRIRLEEGALHPDSDPVVL